MKRVSSAENYLLIGHVLAMAFGLAVIILVLPNPDFLARLAEFEWGTDTYVGLIAQEVEKVVPTMVNEIEVNDITDFKEVDPSELIYITVNAIQEQQKMIDELKAENQALKLRIEKLEEN